MDPTGVRKCLLSHPSPAPLLSQVLREDLERAHPSLQSGTRAARGIRINKFRVANDASGFEALDRAAAPQSVGTLASRESVLNRDQ
jgi:hypothetical protein